MNDELVVFDRDAQGQFGLVARVVPCESREVGRGRMGRLDAIEGDELTAGRDPQAANRALRIALDIPN